jgi:hypothetical protein
MGEWSFRKSWASSVRLFEPTADRKEGNQFAILSRRFGRSAREDMLRSIAELSKELADKTSFAEEARDRIVKYRKLLKQGTLTQLQSAIGAATTLVAGCLYVADKIKIILR